VEAFELFEDLLEELDSKKLPSIARQRLADKDEVTMVFIDNICG
jgi:hypothetical protein